MGQPQKPDYSNFRKQFRGGNDTARQTALLELGAYSRVVNMRQYHPGMDQRPGQTKLHTVADGTNRVMSLFQFSKAKISEKHLFAQMSDGDVLEATSAPPATTTGAFGSSVFSGSAGQVPASWSTIGDKMLHSNGVDQHQIYAGNNAQVNKFIVYKGSGAIPAIPTMGIDYTTEVTDDDTSKYAELDSLGTLSGDYDCLFIGLPVMGNAVNFTVLTGHVNTNAAVMGIKYKNTSGLTDVSGLTDNTASTGCTLGKPGTYSVTFTKPTDAIPSFMFGMSCYWLQVYLSSGSLSSDVQVSHVTFNAPWQEIINLWDGVPVDAIEAQLYDASAGTYLRFAASSIDITGMTTADILYIASVDPIEAIYIDPGSTPNTATAVAIADVKYHNGSAFASVGTITDGSAGGTKAGWVTLPRCAATPIQFQTTQYYAYWYAITISGGTITGADDVYIGIKTMPYFDIDEFGKGLANITWKSRVMWVFDKYPSWLLASAKNLPMTLNGDDFAILEAGDGRLNKIVCMRKFHNEYMVWQEEKGVEGGCLTLFEGYSPATYGKLVLSTRLGTFNAHSAAVVDGVMTSTGTDNEVKTLAFFLSHEGVARCDGKTCDIVSDAVQNYFNPIKPECIRRGYEDKMWLKYDRAFNILRIGLVSGASATQCNVFPVYDIADGTWSFDELGQNLATMEEIEADSGNIMRIQIGGGTEDGTVYQLNVGQNDCEEEIDAYVDMEFDGKGDVIAITEGIVRTVSGSGTCTITAWQDGVAATGPDGSTRQWTVP